MCLLFGFIAKHAFTVECHFLDVFGGDACESVIRIALVIHFQVVSDGTSALNLNLQTHSWSETKPCGSFITSGCLAPVGIGHGAGSPIHNSVHSTAGKRSASKWTWNGSTAYEWSKPTLAGIIAHSCQVSQHTVLFPKTETSFSFSHNSPKEEETIV